MKKKQITMFVCEPMWVRRVKKRVKKAMPKGKLMETKPWWDTSDLESGPVTGLCRVSTPFKILIVLWEMKAAETI